MSEFDTILNFPNYYSACDIEHGSHGPEVIKGKAIEDELFISIYHYLQYINENPANYDTIALGKYLTLKSTTYVKCKYICQSYEINKFNLQLLKKERIIFAKYKNKNNPTNTNTGKYKRCSKCGAWHDASFAFCAPCNGKSNRNNSYGEDSFY